MRNRHPDPVNYLEVVDFFEMIESNLQDRIEMAAEEEEEEEEEEE